MNLDVNGGEELVVKEIFIDCDKEYGDLPTAERTGYTFTGWITENEGGEEIKSGDIVKITEEQTLHAHWVINQYTIIFEVDGGSECENIIQDYNTEIVLPEPEKTVYTFDCWCSDPELSREYSETTMPNERLILYAKWNINKYNLTFVFDNGAENEVRTLNFNEEIVYPENVKKTGYTFSEWDNKPDRMPAENITITAQWNINQYTVTFDVNGGNTLSESESKKEVTYDSTYGNLPEATRTGYTFLGWFTGKTGGTNTTAEDIVQITANQTLYAHWIIISTAPTNQTEVPTKQVEIVFSKKSMSQAEVEKIIEQYTEASFEIALIEGNNSGTGEIRVIIKFTDIDVAKEFVRNVNDGLNLAKKVI